MNTTIKDIAERVGKSVSTVSKALNDFDDISFETKEIIRKAASEMGYVPNAVAQRLKKKRTDTIGIILPVLNDRFLNSNLGMILEGIDNYLYHRGFEIVVSMCSPGSQEIDIYRQKIQGKRVDGFIITHTRNRDERIEFLLDIDFPFVACGRVANKQKFPFVDVDNVHGMNLVVNYLINLGHRRIAVITPPRYLEYSQRCLEAISLKLYEAGIDLNEDNILEGDLTQRSGYIQSLILLGKPTPPTAIIACNDMMAIGAMSAAHSKGIKVGSEVSITGFDDIPMAEYSFPPLTTVHQPFYKIGELLGEILISQIIEKKTYVREKILQPSLIVRQSCGRHIPGKKE